MKMVDNMMEFFSGFKYMKNEIDQQICRKFVDREVYCNVNWMTEYILSKDDRDAPFTWDDISNFYSYPEHSSGNLYFEGGRECDKNDFLEDLVEQMDVIDEIVEALEEQIDQIEEDIADIRGEFLANQRIEKMRDSINEIRDIIEKHKTDREKLSEFYDEVEDLESEPQEIYEWWMVSKWLADKLDLMGHPVIIDHEIWGRCTSGQAIYMDYAIRQIAENMEILCGQQYQWTV